MPTGDWWTNWGSRSSEAQQAAADMFLRTGNMGTPIGGTVCRGSNECASGYACSQGRCVPVNESEPGNDGTLNGCGGEGGGPCDSLTEDNVGIRVSGGDWVYGDVVRIESGTAVGYQWEPVYAADGCTIAGCKLGRCGAENASDCPGSRYCRYNQYGDVSCKCGAVPPSPCSIFCSLYNASYGESAAGCEGLVCDECQTCDNNYFSSTYGKCISSGSGPCHCNAGNLPECYKCNDQGTSELDTSCKECYTTNVDCGCGEPFQKTCCYTLEELKNGLTGYNRCAESVNCSEVCGDKAYVDPCEGDCTAQTQSGSGACPSEVTGLADGHKAVLTGCIETGGNYTLLYNDCDVSNVPESCKECDCNCNNDCPDCLLCGADGKCYPDPSCGDSACGNVSYQIYESRYLERGSSSCTPNQYRISNNLPLGIDTLLNVRLNSVSASTDTNSTSNRCAGGGCTNIPGTNIEVVRIDYLACDGTPGAVTSVKPNGRVNCISVYTESSYTYAVELCYNGNCSGYPGDPTDTGWLLI